MPKRLGGWWRLWIVLSICYGACVLAFVWSLWPDASSVGDEAILARVPNDVLILALGRADSPTAVLALPYGRNMEVNSATSVAERAQISNAFAAAHAAALNHERLTFVAIALLAWLTPCIALLIIGAAGNWIYQGFGRKPHEP